MYRVLSILHYLMPFAQIGGKLGFYYKEHEILPPLPGDNRVCLHLAQSTIYCNESCKIFLSYYWVTLIFKKSACPVSLHYLYDDGTCPPFSGFHFVNLLGQKYDPTNWLNLHPSLSHSFEWSGKIWPTDQKKKQWIGSQWSSKYDIFCLLYLFVKWMKWWIPAPLC